MDYFPSAGDDLCYSLCCACVTSIFAHFRNRHQPPPSLLPSMMNWLNRNHNWGCLNGLSALVKPRCQAIAPGERRPRLGLFCVALLFSGDCGQSLTCSGWSGKIVWGGWHCILRDQSLRLQEPQMRAATLAYLITIKPCGVLMRCRCVTGLPLKLDLVANRSVDLFLCQTQNLTQRYYSVKTSQRNASPVDEEKHFV